MTRPANIQGDTRHLRAADTPTEARVEGLDGDEAAMFPLLTAAQAAEWLACSVDHVHDLAARGQLPYVLLPASGRSGNAETEGRRRRFRPDTLRAHVRTWTVA